MGQGASGGPRGPTWLAEMAGHPHFRAIVAYLDWPERAAVLQLDKGIHEALAERPSWWLYLARLLAEERGTYLGPYFGQAEATPAPRAAFFDLWEDAFPLRRGRRTRINEALKPIRVFARFRPRMAQDEAREVAAAADDAPTITIPLHQRLQLIKAARPDVTTTAEAMKVLMSARGMDLDRADPWANAEAMVEKREDRGLGGEAEACVLSEKSVNEEVDPFAQDRFGCQVISVNAGANGSVGMLAPGVGLRNFGTDHLFDDARSQQHVYKVAASPAVGDVLNGRNAALVCYGQTGSGKTHTMFGPPDWLRQLRVSRSELHSSQDFAQGADAGGHARFHKYSNYLKQVGVVPRALLEVFHAVEQRRAAGVAVHVGLSYLEVFGESVTDLLLTGGQAGASDEVTNVAVQHRRALAGEMEAAVADLEAALALLEAAEGRKRWGETLMNARSSRAHTLLLLRLVQEEGDEEKTSTLILADLGGSEKIGKSGAVESDTRLLEAININRGLFNLHRCARALARGSSHVPFNSSRLTQLLEPALSGGSKLSVMVTASDAKCHAPETLQAMRFLEDCGSLEMDGAGAGVTLIAASVLRGLDKEIARYEGLIRDRERWVTRREVFVDEFGETQVKNTTTLVGAERERAALEELLERRRMLIGAGPETDDDAVAAVAAAVEEATLPAAASAAGVVAAQA